MRTSVIEINGEKHLLCFNLYALKACSERYGSFAGISEALKKAEEAERMDEVLWLLETLMKGGEVYAKTMHMDNAEPLSAEHMLAVCDAGFFKGLTVKIIAVINDGMNAAVEVQSSKNGETTQEK